MTIARGYASVLFESRILTFSHSGPGTMKLKGQYVDWHLFWFMQVGFLSVPLFVAVFSLGKSEVISPHGATALAFTWLGLTVLNVSISRFLAFRRSKSDL